MEIYLIKEYLDSSSWALIVPWVTMSINIELLILVIRYHIVALTHFLVPAMPIPRISIYPYLWQESLTIAISGKS